MSKSALDYYHAGMRARHDKQPRPDQAAVSWQAQSFLRGWDDANRVLEDDAKRPAKAEVQVWMDECTDPWPQAARAHERFLQAEMKKILPVSRMIRLSKALKRLQTRWNARP